MNKYWFIFLNDGETFSHVDGCTLVQVPENLLDELDCDPHVSDLAKMGCKVLPINMGELADVE